MLERAVLDEGAVGDVVVIRDQTVREAEADDGVRVEFCGAEEDHVAEAFGGAVFAGDGVGGVVDARNKQVRIRGIRESRDDECLPADV